MYVAMYKLATSVLNNSEITWLPSSDMHDHCKIICYLVMMHRTEYLCLK